MLNKKFNPVYKERSDKGDTTEFYFRAQGFTYPANQKPVQLGVWTSDQRTLDSGNKFYGFGPQEAYFSTNTGEEKLGVICIK